MTSTMLQNYFCDSCTQSIEPTNPRVHCTSCDDYDLCANCALGEKVSKDHQTTHQSQVFKESGGIFRYPTPSVYTISLFRTPQILVLDQSDSTSLALPENSITDVPPSLHQTFNVESGWKPFFNPDMTPTPTYTTLMDDIFAYLDPQNMGTLLPETFSRFLDDLGYLPFENPWKNGLIATFNTSKESNADKSLKNAFDLFYIDHVLLQRTQTTHAYTGRTGLSSVLGNLTPPLPAPVPSMPALTRKGFIDITMIEVLSDPAREWGNLNRLLHRYRILRYDTWGDLPRTVLPAGPDQAMLDRVKGAVTLARQKAEREAEDARAASTRANFVTGVDRVATNGTPRASGGFRF